MNCKSDALVTLPKVGGRAPPVNETTGEEHEHNACLAAVPDTHPVWLARIGVNITRESEPSVGMGQFRPTAGG